MILERWLGCRILLPCLMGLFLLATSRNGIAADNVIHLISAEIPGGRLELKDGKYVGAYPTFFRTASKDLGIQIDYRLVPWARAVKETEQSDNLIVFPLTRTEKRESQFTWLAQINEEPMCFASVGSPVSSLAAARKLKRVLVWRGSSHQEYLEIHGFQNLIVISSEEEVIRILNAQHDAVWYYICDEAQVIIDPNRVNISLNIGNYVFIETIWVAGGKSLKRTAQINEFVDSIDSLKNRKLLQKLLSETNK